MSTLKQSRRKSGTEKLEPIDWHEYANDAVLNGNMSTLYHRPPSEDPTAYASPEALLEIEKRAGRPDAGPTVGRGGTAGITAARDDDEVGSSDPDSRVPAVGKVFAVGVWRATAAGEGVPFPSSPPLNQDRATVEVRPAAALESPAG